MSNDNTPEINTDALLQAVAPLLASTVAGVLVSAVMSKVREASSTNRHESKYSGDKESRPTKKETNLSENNASGTKVESNLANDEVNIQQGSVEASESEATASTVEATASEAGASASRVKSGASDIETKALKMM